MKTINVWISLVVAVLLFTTIKAQAFFDPTIGRWVNRDPIGEQGCLNLFIIDSNDLINSFDYLGLTTRSARNKILVFDQGKRISLIWPKDKTCCSGKNIGSLVNVFSVIDATRMESLAEVDPNLINQIQSSLSISTKGTASLNTPSYVGAGMIINYEPNRYGKACCLSPRFVAEKSGSLYGWSDDGSFAGNSWFDMPGDTISGYFSRNFGRQYKLTFYCDNTPIKILNWSYEVSYSRKSKNTVVTLSTPF